MDRKITEYFKDPRKITMVKPLDGYALLITFDNGEVRKYEMEDELTGVFKVLKDKKKFNEVFINDVGNIAWNISDHVDSSVYWENQIDLCKDMLYLNSIALM